MRLDTQWDLLAALPYLAVGAGLTWLCATLLLRQTSRLRRRRQQRAEEAARRAAGPTPWHDWLREINEQTERTALGVGQGRSRGK